MSSLSDALLTYAARASDPNHPDGWLCVWPSEVVETVEAAGHELESLREAVKVRDEHIEALLRECAAGRNPTRALRLVGSALITLGKALKTISDE